MRRDIMQYDLTDMMMFFLIYGFDGFLLETIFRTITTRKIVISRGFLTNCFCPLYGLCGILMVQIFTLSEITINSRLAALITATIGSILTVTLLEYVTGRILDKLFNHKMWDYSHIQFNLHSYVCRDLHSFPTRRSSDLLDFSLIWGIIAIILANFIHPFIEIAVYAIPQATKLIVLYFASSLLIINASFNMRKMHHLNFIKL